MGKNKQTDLQPAKQAEILPQNQIDALIDYMVEKSDLPKWCDSDSNNKRQAVFMLSNGKSHLETAKQLGIHRISLEIWEQTDDLFRECLAFIKKMIAKDIEQLSWQVAAGDIKSKEERMFIMKRMFPEYRDNVTPTLGGSVKLNITFENNPFDISASYQQIEAPKKDDED